MQFVPLQNMIFVYNCECFSKVYKTGYKFLKEKSYERLLVITFYFYCKLRTKAKIIRNITGNYLSLLLQTPHESRGYFATLLQSSSRLSRNQMSKGLEVFWNHRRPPGRLAVCSFHRKTFQNLVRPFLEYDHPERQDARYK